MELGGSHKKERRQISYKFGAIALISLLWLAGLSIFYLLPQVKSALVSAYRDTHSAMIETEIQRLEWLFEHKRETAVNIASNELLTNALLLAANDNIDMISYLNSIKFHGGDLPLAVIDILGGQLFSSIQATSLNDDTLNSLTLPILSGASDRRIQLAETSKGSSLLMAVPVLYQGSPEGVLIAMFPLTAEDIYGLNHVPDGEMVRLSIGTDQVVMGEIVSEHKYKVEGRLQNFDAGYIFETDISAMAEKEEQLVDSIVFTIAGMISISFVILVTLGIRLLVEPYQNLGEAQSKLKTINEKLTAALAEAHEAKEMKGRFLANMSHEIRTPMNGVLMALDLAKTSKDPVEVKGLVKTANKAAQSLIQIINDILDFSKMESGKLDIREEKFAPVHLFDSIENLLAPLAKNKNLSFDLTKTNIDGIIVSDENRLRQIINNLVGNAIKFTSHGGVSIDARIQDENGQSQLSVKVSDTGPGLTPNEQKKLFERFSQLDKNQAGVVGTGLGLAICKQLIELMNGEIGIESDGITGSQFWFKLPVTVASVSEVTNTHDTTDAELPKYKILIAEDVRMNQMLIQKLLTKMGHSTTIVENGTQAVEIIEKEETPFDLILMDNQMPEMGGIMATQLIRLSSGKYKDIPIIAFSADAIIEKQREFTKAGMNGFVSKPVDRLKLEFEIQRVMAETSKKQTPPTAVSEQLHRIVYISQSTEDTVDLEAIVKVAAKNNQENQLSGVLWKYDNRFIQVLEGSEEALHRTLLKIVRDDRHTNVTILENIPVTKRYFKGWAMTAVDDEAMISKYLKGRLKTDMAPYMLDTEVLIRALLGSSDSADIKYKST